MTRMSKALGVAVASVLGLANAVGCSSASGGPDDDLVPPAGSNTASPIEEPEEDAGEAESIAALERLFVDFWGALVTLENADELPLDVFDGIATDEVKEAEFSRVKELKDFGITGRGEPVITEMTADQG